MSLDYVVYKESRSPMRAEEERVGIPHTSQVALLWPQQPIRRLVQYTHNTHCLLSVHRRHLTLFVLVCCQPRHALTSVPSGGAQPHPSHLHNCPYVLCVHRFSSFFVYTFFFRSGSVLEKMQWWMHYANRLTKIRTFAHISSNRAN